MKWCKWLAVILVALYVQPAHSYNCWLQQHPYYQLQDADVVFAGKVEAVTEIGRDMNELGTTRYQITAKPYDVWKGLTPDDNKVLMDVESFYGYDFQPESFYLFFGYRIYPDRITLIGCPRIKLLNLEVYSTLRSIQKPVFALANLPESITGKPEIEPDSMQFRIEEGEYPLEPPLDETGAPITRPPEEIIPDMMDSAKEEVKPEERDMLEAFKEKAGDLQRALPEVMEPVMPAEPGPLTTRPRDDVELNLPQAQQLNGQLDKLLTGNGEAAKQPPSPQARQVEEAVKEALPEVETLPEIETLPEMPTLPQMPELEELPPIPMPPAP